jgi:hypothetical protein
MSRFRIDCQQSLHASRCSPSATAAQWMGPSVVFRLGDKFTGTSLRIPTAHAASVRVTDQGRLALVLPRGAEMSCSITRSILQLRTGWAAISAALQLRTGSTQQPPLSHCQAVRRSRRCSRQSCSISCLAPAACGTAADRSAEQQLATQPGLDAAAATAAAAATGVDPAAVLRVKLPGKYAGRQCTIPQAMRPQLEALLPGSDSSRPFMLVLPRRKQLPVAYRMDASSKAGRLCTRR